MATRCERCVNSIFNALMGEYKCKVHQHIVYDAIHCDGCKYFEDMKGNKNNDKN